MNGIVIRSAWLSRSKIFGTPTRLASRAVGGIHPRDERSLLNVYAYVSYYWD